MRILNFLHTRRGQTRIFARGFTLIELLLVIAIIAILASIILASLNDARSNAYDAQRVAEMNSVKTALELYHADHKEYPHQDTMTSECASWGSATPDNVIPGLVPKYIPSMPEDPNMDKVNSTNCYVYVSQNAGQDYKFFDMNMTKGNLASEPTLVDPKRNVGQSWQRTDNVCTGNLSTPTWAIWSSDTSICW